MKYRLRPREILRAEPEGRKKISTQPFIFIFIYFFGPFICIGRKIQCLLYAEFLVIENIPVLVLVLHSYSYTVFHLLLHSYCTVARSQARPAEYIAITAEGQSD